jgi:RNA polymerase primary sigma factor
MERGDAIRLPVHVHEKLLAIRRASFQFQSEHGYEPSAQELADYTGKTLAHVQTLMEANFTYVSMNVSADEDLRNSSDFIGNLLDPQTPDIHETVEQNETAELVHLALECLSEKERDILKRRFGIGEYPKQQTLFEVGEAHHVTRERIRQIEVIALNKFKKAILRIQHEAIAKTRKPRRKAA